MFNVKRAASSEKKNSKFVAFQPHNFNVIVQSYCPNQYNIQM